MKYGIVAKMPRNYVFDEAKNQEVGGGWMTNHITQS